MIDRVIDDYLDSARVVAGLLESDEVRDGWESPSVLSEWSVAGLAGHLARSVLLLPSILDAPVDEAAPLASAAEYFIAGLSDADLDIDSDMARAIRERGLTEAGSGHRELVSRYGQVLGALEVRLRAQEPGLGVAALGMRLALADYLVTRLVEFTVHADDLALSVGVATPAFRQPVEDVVASTLAMVAVRRHGFPEVLRGLARSERAPQRFSAF